MSRRPLLAPIFTLLALAGEARAHEPEGATVRGTGPARAASEFNLDIGELRAVPRGSAAEFLSLAPGFFLSQHGGDGKANQIFLRGFDAQHGQDVEFTVGGMPSNDVSNVHGQGYADLNWVIPEVVDRLRVLEGPYDPRQGDFAVAGSARLRPRRRGAGRAPARAVRDVRRRPGPRALRAPRRSDARPSSRESSPAATASARTARRRAPR